MEITKTNKTEKAYEKRFDLLCARFYKETSRDAYQDQDTFSYWLDSIRKNVTQATWRQYRASINHSLPKSTDKIKAVLSLKGEVKRTQSINTSRKKKKSIKDEEYNLLIQKLGNSRSKYKSLLINLIISSYTAGLRPSEWIGASYDKEKKLLTVRNAKNTNGRSFGKARHLHLDDISEEQRFAISSTTSVFEAISEEDYGRIYESCRSLLRKTYNSLFSKSKKNVSLYSFRHQFIANLKKNGYLKKEVSALVGHKTTDTAQEHYGKKIDGIIIDKMVLPNKEDIAQVVENPSNFDLSKRKVLLSKNSQSSS